MRKLGKTLHRLCLVLAVLLAACTPRQESPPSAPSPPVRAPQPAPQAPWPPESPEAPAVKGDDERDAVLFTAWRSRYAAEVEAFEEYLVQQHVAQVVPTYQLLRSASMWKECRAEPFDLPPPESWETVRDVLILLRELKKKQILPSFEVVSAYRHPKLNRCAGGAPGSSHVRFAVDIAPVAPEDGDRLCRFWREHGREWDMGVSRYPSGRIHIDRTGYRTWGASHKRASSYCLQ